MSNKCFLIFLAFLFSVSAYSQHRRLRSSLISSRVMSTEKKVVDFATVYLKGTDQGCYTDEESIYHLKTTAGEYTLVVSATGYQTVEKKVKLAKGERIKVNITIAPVVKELGEVLVTTSGVGRVNQSAFNAVAIDVKKLYNSTQTLASALTKVPGVKLRESGGVGSDMRLYIDGFSGKHVKIFIDGIPQEGVGAAFDLNNVPINFADRIEVCKGVVPVGFGTDAIGEVANIVTNKQPGKWFMDASYSYGSFNTHKSYVRFGQTFKNGFMYEVNAFQNFSDNDYYVDTYVREFEIKEDGSVRFPPLDKNKIYHLKRFNDQYHPDYYVNFEEIGTKHPVFRCWHISEDYFLLQLYKNGVEDMISGGTNADVSELAVFKAEDKTITLVVGLPADGKFGGKPYGEKGYAYMADAITTVG